MGRLLIPSALREYAGLTRDVVWTGSLKYIELWDKSPARAEARGDPRRPREGHGDCAAHGRAGVVMESFVHESVMLRETLAAIAPRSGGVYADATLAAGATPKRSCRRARPTGAWSRLDRDPDGGRSGAAQARGVRRARAWWCTATTRSCPRCSASAAAAGASTAWSPTSASARRSSTPPSAASRSAQKGRSTCAWTRARASRSRAARPLGERELADIIYEYGEERRSRAVARSIVRAREQGELETTADLRRAVLRALGRQARRGIDPATRTFQALRIAVNGELDQLDALLDALPELLERRGGGGDHLVPLARGSAGQARVPRRRAPRAARQEADHGERRGAGEQPHARAARSCAPRAGCRAGKRRCEA